MFKLSQANTSSTTKFKLPSLKLDSTKSSESSMPNNISDFASLPLNTPKFMIPNIFSTKPIDLKSALMSESEKKKLPREGKFEKKDEDFIPKFVECDLKTNCQTEHIDDVNFVICPSTLRDLIDETVPINPPTMMGKIIGKRYKKRVHYPIRHAYEPPLQDINRFRFNVPSPDDQILAHLQKK